MFPDYSSFLVHLKGKGCFRMRPGLEMMSQAVEKMCIPPLPAVQVVGTNGKGSTAVFLESLARFHGLKTGLYTSPHLVSVRERIRINGRVLAEKDWVRLVSQVYAAWPEADLTYFELLTAMALAAFAEARVDLVVLEAGLGAAGDATSVMHPLLSLVCPVGMDHEKVIGPRLQDIARDKAAAVLAPGGAVVGAQHPRVWEVLRTRASAVGAPLVRARDWWRPGKDGAFFGLVQGPEVQVSDLGLKGKFQIQNAMLALTGWKILSLRRGWPFEPGRCIQALACARHAGRFQFVDAGPGFIIDGAHNVPGMKALERALRQLDIDVRAAVFTCLKDKAGLVEQIRRLARGPIFVPALPGNERGNDPAALAQKLGGISVADVSEALERTMELEGPVLVCGSLYLAGAFLQCLQKKFFGLDMGLVKDISSMEDAL